MLNKLLCDSGGVPLLIQKLRYCRGDMTFKVLFFNGKSKVFCEEHVGNCMSLMQGSPTRMQELQVTNSIEKLAVNNWPKWFPYLRAVTA